MGKRNTKNTKGKIITAAWKLFYEQGFDNTTIEDIVFESGTSNGSFYHYFTGKDALTETLSDMFDEKYQELMKAADSGQDTIGRLIWLNRELFDMIDRSIPAELLSRLLSSQLLNHGSSLLDHGRYYFRLLKSIITEGQKRSELRNDLSSDDILRDYAMLERALMYDWCLHSGEYELTAYSGRILPAFLEQYRTETGTAEKCGREQTQKQADVKNIDNIR